MIWQDVARSIAFYSDAFGCHVRRLDESHRWGELESGQTTIAFTPAHQRETDEVAGAVADPATDKRRPPLELCFAYPDVDAAYKVNPWSSFRFFSVSPSSLSALVLSLRFICSLLSLSRSGHGVLQRAVEKGAVAVSQPEEREWGQKVGYVRDIDGIIVRMGSYVRPPASH
ncbi:hypothetical protein EJ110_NYTH05663 [Nymphaea thermarum]|nr:hypothetical protein EJ110_NYTH05663 [Nymphaea thermarum]